MKGVDIEIVDAYKYLGVIIDNKLTWAQHIDKVYKKAQSRLFFLRKLKSFNVCNKMLLMFYETVICSIFSFALVCWGGNATLRDKNKLNKIIKKAESCVGSKLDGIDIILSNVLMKKALKIEKTELHPLHGILMMFKSRSNSRTKYVLPCISSDRYGKSFIPSGIKCLNAKK